MIQELANKVLRHWSSILFNAGVAVTIYYSGKFLSRSIEEILGILITFTLVRVLIKKAKHYKEWQLCFLWCTAIFTTLFLVCSVSFALSLLLSIFAAIIMSNHADIYQWSPHMERKNKLKKISSIDDFEALLSNMLIKPKHKDLLRYIYIEDMTLMQAAEKLNIEYSTVKVWHSEALARLQTAL